MLTVRCFQMRLSVSSVSYSSTQPGKRSVKDSMKSSSDPSRVRLSSARFLSLRCGEGWCRGIWAGRSR